MNGRISNRKPSYPYETNFTKKKKTLKHPLFSKKYHNVLEDEGIIEKL